MWLLLVVPIVIVGVVSALGFTKRLPTLHGLDPIGLRTVVSWRDEPMTAADIAGEPKEQLRQIVNVLAERGVIFSSTIDDGHAGERHEPIAIVDVRADRFELRARTHSAGRWLLWIDRVGRAPDDSDDLRTLLLGVHRALEARRGEEIAWHRRESLAGSIGAQSPFYVD